MSNNVILKTATHSFEENMELISYLLSLQKQLPNGNSTIFVTFAQP